MDLLYNLMHPRSKEAKVLPRHPTKQSLWRKLINCSCLDLQTSKSQMHNQWHVAWVNASNAKVAWQGFVNLTLVLKYCFSKAHYPHLSDRTVPWQSWNEANIIREVRGYFQTSSFPGTRQAKAQRLPLDRPNHHMDGNNTFTPVLIPFKLGGKKKCPFLFRTHINTVINHWRTMDI